MTVLSHIARFSSASHSEIRKSQFRLIFTELKDRRIGSDVRDEGENGSDVPSRQGSAIHAEYPRLMQGRGLSIVEVVLYSTQSTTQNWELSL
jgi:hypothetical protein